MKLVPWTTLVSFSGFCKIQCNDYWYSRKGLNQYSWNTDSIKTLMNWYYHVGVQHFLMNICLHLRDAEFLDVPCVVHSNWWVGIQKHVCYRRFRTTCWRLGAIVVLELFLNREKAGRYCNIVLCLDIIYIYILTVLPFLVAYVGGHFQKQELLQSKKTLELGTGERPDSARLKRISSKVWRRRVDVENHQRLRQESGQS